MKKLFDNLLFRVVLAIGLGILLGGIIPESIGNIFATFNGSFDQLLKFLIPLIIVGLIVPAIAKLGNTAGKMLLTTFAIAYVSTLFSGFSTYIASMSIIPSLEENQSVYIQEHIQSLTPYFTLQIPPFFDVMGALVFSFLIGIGLARLQNSKLAEVYYDFGNIIS